jgi:hypothetical protein
MYPIIPAELTPGVIQAVILFFTILGVALGIGCGARA